MKRTAFFITALLISASIASAQTADMPNMPKTAAPPKGPCDAEMKAAMKNMPAPVKGEAAPTKTPSMKPDANSKEAKALQDCLKRNMPAPTSAAVKPPSGTGAPVPDIKKTNALPAGVPPAAPLRATPTSGTTPGATTTGVSCPTIIKELKVGTKDSEVVVLKKYLARSGDLAGVQNTDYFGPATERALKAWQKKAGIPETGITDMRTRTALKNCAAKNVPQQKAGTTKKNP